MVQNRIFCTIRKHLYFVYYHIIFYQRIKVYRVETMDILNIILEQWCQWDYYSGTMVSVENAIVVSTMVLIVLDKIRW